MMVTRGQEVGGKEGWEEDVSNGYEVTVIQEQLLLSIKKSET
jgi:hypothetical protein